MLSLAESPCQVGTGHRANTFPTTAPPYRSGSGVLSLLPPVGYPLGVGFNW